MGIRETLNKHPAIMIAAVTIIILGAGVYVFSFVRSEAAPRYGSVTFYSDDDGRSYFEDSNKLVAPIDHKGKQAYRAYVYSCDDGKTGWVALLEGYRPEAKPKVAELVATMQALAKDPKAKPPPPDKDPVQLLPGINRTNLIVKQPDKPGQPPNKWVSEADGAAYGQAREVVCPHGDATHRITVMLP